MEYFYYIIIILTFIVLTISSILKSNRFKGWYGEYRINQLLLKKLDDRFYTIAINITLPIGDGTTQIDHVVLSPYGIFVIESKNMKGWIYGKAREKNWTLKVFKKNYRIQNPLHQNYKHLKTLEAYLEKPLSSFHSIVVFSDKAEFKTSLPANVLHPGALIDYITSFKEIILSDSEIEDMIAILQENALEENLKNKRQHIAYLQQKHQKTS